MSQFDHDFFATLDDCPAQVTFEKDIRPLFRDVDVAHMKNIQNIDLSSYDSVVIWAAKIYQLVASGRMPPPGSGNRWTPEMVKTFGCWIKQGKPK